MLDRGGQICGSSFAGHEQKISPEGWVSHDPIEIYKNVISAAKKAISAAEKSVSAPENAVSAAGAPKKGEIAAIAITNQRETALVWDRATGTPVRDAVVWQCGRSKPICDALSPHAEFIRWRTGLPLSPFFSASKIAWILRDIGRLGKAKSAVAGKAGAGAAAGAAIAAAGGAVAACKASTAESGASGVAVAAGAAAGLCAGTIDSWLVFKLTGGRVFATDYSNASRTQLMNLETLAWDEEVCALFGVPVSMLGEIRGSDAFYGETDLEGALPRPIPIRAVIGDSHAALFAQGCRQKGGVKATYGTGSSVMMNTGPDIVRSANGLASSLAWGLGGERSYALEGNINYAGAVISWLCELGLLASPKDAGGVAEHAGVRSGVYLVPAFTGLGAPHWIGGGSGGGSGSGDSGSGGGSVDGGSGGGTGAGAGVNAGSGVGAALTGMTRGTGRAEIVRAAEECVAYQIKDIIEAMKADAGTEIAIGELKADGGAANDEFLMRFQADILGIPVAASDREELSAIGAARIAGIAAGLYDRAAPEKITRRVYAPSMDAALRKAKYDGWKKAVNTLKYHIKGEN